MFICVCVLCCSLLSESMIVRLSPFPYCRFPFSLDFITGGCNSPATEVRAEARSDEGSRTPKAPTASVQTPDLRKAAAPTVPKAPKAPRAIAARAAGAAAKESLLRVRLHRKQLDKTKLQPTMVDAVVDDKATSQTHMRRSITSCASCVQAARLIIFEI